MSSTQATSQPKDASRYGAPRQKVPPFARYKGTSAWRKDHRRVREYELFRAAEKLAGESTGASGV